jgi:2-phospho-L-lactate/phosphoenolpyruvate guanylyltransferase
MQAAVLVPVKDFHQAKGRLAAALQADERAALARSMATAVVAAARPLPTFVVCDHDEVAAWAELSGASVLWRPGLGLNGAVSDGVATLATAGYAKVIVAHADLPYALDLTWLAHLDVVTLVPDRRDDGTNVACVPATAGFRFSYGQGSFRRHAAEARRLGTGLRVVREPRLGWDIDLPIDLELPTWMTSPVSRV